MNPPRERENPNGNQRENLERKEIEKIKISTGLEDQTEKIECKSFHTEPTNKTRNQLSGL